MMDAVTLAGVLIKTVFARDHGSSLVGGLSSKPRTQGRTQCGQGRGQQRSWKTSCLLLFLLISLIALQQAASMKSTVKRTQNWAFANLTPARFHLAWIHGQESLTWNELPALPDQEGFAGPFAGNHNDALVVAGGANFPDKMPWEGGAKVWYDRAFVLESPKGTWKEAGKLPRPLGYGVAISTVDGVVCIGGSDANQHYQDCFRLRWQDGKLNSVNLPPLPKTCANACGALLNSTIYISGGLESPTATSTLKNFWSLDLERPNARWQELEPWPGSARMLATAAVQDNSFFLCSGTDLRADADGKAVREYLRDAYRYQPGQGWKKIADLPRAAVAAPTPAPAFGQSSFLVIGGDDGRLIDFKPPQNHPGFPKSILAYDTTSDSWRIVGEVPVGHVTTTMVGWRDRYIMPSGEVRPGKRSPSVWSMKETIQ